jgi:hypothetical protein
MRELTWHEQLSTPFDLVTDTRVNGNALEQLRCCVQEVQCRVQRDVRVDGVEQRVTPHKVTGQAAAIHAARCNTGMGVTRYA